MPSPAAPAERLCREWGAWCNEIAQAAEEGAELPEPPVPKGAVVTTMPSALVRVTEASAFAAAALARSGAQAQERAASLRRELQRMRGELQRLQASRRSKESEASRCNGAGREGIVQDDKAELARLRVALQESEALRHREVEEAKAAAGTAQARLEQTLATLRQLVTMPGEQMIPAASPPVPMPAPDVDSYGRGAGEGCGRRRRSTAEPVASWPGEAGDAKVRYGDPNVGPRHHQSHVQEPFADWQLGTNWMAPHFGRSLQTEALQQQLNPHQAPAPGDGGGGELAEANRRLEREVQDVCRSLGGTILPKPEAARNLPCAGGMACSRGGPPRGGGVRQGAASRRGYFHHRTG